jgi:hypothetical protein
MYDEFNQWTRRLIIKILYAVARMRGCSIPSEHTANMYPPYTCTPRLLGVLRAICKRLVGEQTLKLISAFRIANFPIYTGKGDWE